MTKETKRSLFLHLLLDSYAPKDSARILEKIGKAPFEGHRASCSLKDPLIASEEFLLRIHYSWIASYVSKMSDNIRGSVAKSFPQFSKIIKLLGIETDNGTLKGPSAEFCRGLLIDAIGLNQRLPICFLPKSPFSDLLHWNREELLNLVDYLPLSDAAKEIKKIVDKKQLLLIYSALDEKQKDFLKKIVLAKDFSSGISMNLKSIQGTPLQIRSYLHKVGLDLLAKSLASESEDVLFYLSHLLDVGRGKGLLQAIQKGQKDPKKEIHKNHLTQTINYLTHGKER